MRDKILTKKGENKKRKPFYYTEGNNFNKENNKFLIDYLDKIICGDSLLILKSLPDNCVDIIVTSPP